MNKPLIPSGPSEVFFSKIKLWFNKIRLLTYKLVSLGLVLVNFWSKKAFDIFSGLVITKFTWSTNQVLFGVLFRLAK